MKMNISKTKLQTRTLKRKNVQVFRNSFINKFYSEHVY